MRALLVFSLVACGGNSEPAPDGPIGDPPIDPCDYTEQRDATNDDVAPATGTPEVTGITLGMERIVCGTFDETHFDGDITVDVDTYLFEVSGETDVLVRIHGAGAETIELVGLDVYTGANFDQLVGNNTFYGDHGVAAMRLPAGTYELAAFALHAEAIPAAVPYQITITRDLPDQRCPPFTGGAVDYSEAADAPDNTSNDMVAIPDGAPPALTAANDAPEPTGITITTGVVRLGGVLSDVTVVDQYEDKDTYSINSGDSNELGVQVDWITATDVDFFLFEAGNPSPVIRAITSSMTGPERETFSIKPNTDYWLLVGAETGTAVPASYTATLCGATFAP